MGKIKKETKKKIKTPKTTKKDLNECNNYKALEEDLDKLGDWVADMDEEMTDLIAKVEKMAKRLGLQ